MSAESTIVHDLHVHTRLSACFADKTVSPGDMLRRCAELGIRTVGFADHVWCNPEIAPSDWYAPQGFAQVERLRAELAETEIPEGLRVLVGCESETIAPGQFGISRKFAEQCDFVLLPTSHTHMTEFVRQPRSRQPRAIAENLLEMLGSAAASGLATGIAHPMLPLGMVDATAEVVASVSEAEFEDVFAIAAENGVSVEITTGYLASEEQPWMPETCLTFLAAAKRVGCKFHFGSDAHDPTRLERLAELDFFVEALGLCEADILAL